MINWIDKFNIKIIVLVIAVISIPALAWIGNSLAESDYQTGEMVIELKSVRNIFKDMKKQIESEFPQR